MRRTSLPVLIAVLFAALLALSACGGGDPEALDAAGPTREVTREVPVTRVVEVPVTVPAPDQAPPERPAPRPVSAEIPFATLWVGSAHAATDAEAFVHWDDADPPEVPATCAKCHSSSGFQDFLGVDGTQAGVVDGPAEIGSVIGCAACHNEATVAMTSVTFPSGVTVEGLAPEARCMACHQGRASTEQVNQSIVRATVTEPDAVSAEIGFTNIHYLAAAATQFGGVAAGGYQYEGQTYDGKFAHVEGYDTCVSCHDPHSLEIELEACAACHDGVGSREDLRDIRMAGSLADYDGDGDTDEGIYFEIESLRDTLLEAIRIYAADVSGTAIVYDSHSHPYFFIDTNGNGAADEGEAVSANRYNAWTARLARAAYNYQMSLKDTGAYAHGGKYIIQLLFDSIADLNAALPEPMDTSGLRRTGAGHFAGSEEAFRHWDAEGAVPGSCSKCHSAAGLPLLVREGVTMSQAPSGGLACTTCHDSLAEFTRHAVASVAFPSGAAVDTGSPDANLCSTCHQGRESTASVDRATGELDDDTVADLSFRNVHYYGAGATLMGTEARGAYEYAGREYVGRNEHVGAFSTCTDCHDPHALDVRVESCAACHEGVESAEDLGNVRMGGPDYDGDGDRREGIAGEVETLHEALYAAIRDYAREVAGSPIAYDAHSHPYFFIDGNGNGVADPDEAVRANQYASWTPRLLRAAYNYQYVIKDPGAYAHNARYAIQVLYDGLEDLGTRIPVDMKGTSRP